MVVGGGGRCVGGGSRWWWVVVVGGGRWLVVVGGGVNGKNHKYKMKKHLSKIGRVRGDETFHFIFFSNGIP